jgi:kynurenine 3-monooxygenase
MSSGSQVTVIGGGLAGGLVSIFLARQGYRVGLYESRPDMRKEQISAGRSINLALANRGLTPLKRVGLGEQVDALLTTMRGRMIHGEQGSLDLQPYGQHEWEVIYSISRPGLNTLLLDEAESQGVEINFSTPCIEANFDKRVFTFRRGQDGNYFELPMQRAIAADGAGSVVRKGMMKLPHYEESVDWLTHDYKELSIPPGDDGKHRMDPHALHIWPRGGYMLIALPNLDGSFTVTLFLARKGKPGFDTLDTPRAARTLFSEVFPDALELMPNFEEEFANNPTGELGTVRCYPWHVEDRVALMGDAAHAVVPFHGQGMNCAFEDAACFADCVAEAGDDPDWCEVMANYTGRRKRNADSIADMAIENYTEMRDSVREPGYLLKTQLAFELERRHPDRFVPRYSMVMFRDDISYAQAQSRGAIQNKILDTLTAGKTRTEDCDLTHADEIITQRLQPLGV